MPIQLFKFVNVVFVTPTAIDSFNDTFKLSDDKAEGSPPPWREAVDAPLGSAEETIST